MTSEQAARDAAWEARGLANAYAYRHGHLAESEPEIADAWLAGYRSALEAAAQLCEQFKYQVRWENDVAVTSANSSAEFHAARIRALAGREGA